MAERRPAGCAMPDRCPGSGFKTGHYRSTHQVERYYALCPFCRRGFGVNFDGRLRQHRGLPPRPDGGCPYRCTTDCDFNCYHPKGD